MSELSGHLDGKIHVFPIRVYYEDTDAGGIVYHANHVRFAERARTEMMRLLGVSHSGLLKDTGVAFGVRRLTIDYRASARLDDTLEVHSNISDIGGATLAMRQTIRRDGIELARLEVGLFFMSRDGRPVRMPAPLRATLAPYVARTDLT
ncbi:MAG TPA: tol-pal system-associated acyl-CoA thioesterase [Azospirillaceae bacterium]|nr:tol-pal system-associated acyl-CoA thioesterase [Azospirillaceae bacterium]